MIDLDENIKEITEFRTNSISNFESENGDLIAIGIYCCPWSGLITTNFNVKAKLIGTENNCSNFDYL